MEHRNTLGMIAGYYLSRFDAASYMNLGFGTKAKSHATLGNALGVPANSIKGWRDEFDPIHDNSRRGRHQRALRPSRSRVAEALSALSEPELRRLVLSLIARPDSAESVALAASVGAGTGEVNAEIDSGAGARGITGQHAEEAFVTYHGVHGLPVAGSLIDRRVEQCGYDFQIHSGAEPYAIEVKGIADQRGGISFTDKEWQLAADLGSRYIVAVARDVYRSPKFDFIADPHSSLSPRLYSYTVVQVNWSVSPGELERVLR